MKIGVPKMTQQSESEAASDCPADISLVGLSVVLIAEGIDPSAINPDMLRHAEIVPSDLQTDGAPFSTPIQSHITYEDNVTVVAEPRRFFVVQHGDPLDRGECMAPGIAQRFLEKMSHLGYRSVGINPKGFLLLEDGTPDSMLRVLHEKGDWLSFKDESPEIGLQAMYRYEGRTINMDVRFAQKEEEGSNALSGLFFDANIHRNVSKIPKQSKRLSQLSEILADWEQDVTDFCKLASKFSFDEASQ